MTNGPVSVLEQDRVLRRPVPILSSRQLPPGAQTELGTWKTPYSPQNAVMIQ